MFDTKLHRQQIKVNHKILKNKMLTTLDQSMSHAEYIVLTVTAFSSVQLLLSRDVSAIRHDPLHLDWTERGDRCTG